MNLSFYSLLTSQTSTNLGFALYTMVVVMYVYNSTGSTTLSAGVTLISFIARMISGIFLPLVVDRYRLRNLIVFSQFIQLVMLGVLYPLLHSQNLMNQVLVFIVIAIISIFNGWFSPIKSTIVRSIVHEDKRVRANSLLSTVDQTFLFGGWTFGGMLIAFLGKEITLVVTIILIIISIVSLVFIPSKSGFGSTIKGKEPLFQQLTSGWKFLFKHSGIRVIITMDLLEAWVGTVWIGAVTLAFVKEALKEGDSWWGFINGAYYLGSIVGGLLAFRISKILSRHLTRFMLLGSIIFGVLTFAYGFVTNSYLALLLVFLMGPFYQIRDLAQETMFQNSTDEKTLAKIFAARSTLVQLIFTFSILVIGGLVDFAGVRVVYIVAGCILIISSLYGFIQLYVMKQGVSLEKPTAI